MLCKWVNCNNINYVNYHNTEWGRETHDERLLFELLVLESFQAGLSWECVLNKREAFKECFDNFDVVKVSKYTEEKINELMNNKEIVRNRRKIEAAIKNARVFIEIANEWKTFDKYIWHFTNGKVIKNKDNCFKTTSQLSDEVSSSLKKYGMSFVGSTIIYSYLQAIGVIDDHELECDYY